jgi:hypothetical protein
MINLPIALDRSTATLVAEIRIGMIWAIVNENTMMLTRIWPVDLHCNPSRSGTVMSRK